MMSMFLSALNADVPRPLRFSWQAEWLTGLDLCALEAENECVSLLQSWKKPVNSSSALCYFSLNGRALARAARCWLSFLSRADVSLKLLERRIK